MLSVPNEPMMTAPRVAHAGVVGACALVATAIAFGVARALHGNSEAVTLGPLVVALSAIPALLPVFLSGRVAVSKWGMFAFAGTVVQPMVLMALGLLFEQTNPVTPRAYWISCLVGGVLVLIVQVSAALYVLSRATASPRRDTSSSPSGASEAV